MVDISDGGNFLFGQRGYIYKTMSNVRLKKGPTF